MTDDVDEKMAFLQMLNPLLAIGHSEKFISVISPLLKIEDSKLLIDYLISIRFPISFQVVIADENAEGDGESSPITLLPALHPYESLVLCEELRMKNTPCTFVYFDTSIGSSISFDVDLTTLSAVNIFLLPLEENHQVPEYANVRQKLIESKSCFKNLRHDVSDPHSTIITSVPTATASYFLIVISSLSESRNGRFLQEFIYDHHTNTIINGTVSFTFFSDDDCNSHYYKQVNLNAPCSLSDLNSSLMSIATVMKEELEIFSGDIKTLRRSLPIFRSKIDWEKIVFSKVTESLKENASPIISSINNE